MCWRLLQLHHIFCNIHCKYVCIYPDSPSTTKASKRNDAAACLFIQPPHQNTTASIKWPSLYILFYSSSLLGKAVMMNMHNNNIQMNPMWRFLICALEWCNLAQSVFQSIVVEILFYLSIHSFSQSNLGDSHSMTLFMLQLSHWQFPQYSATNILQIVVVNVKI